MELLLEKINKASLKLLSPFNPEEMYQTIVEEARKIVSADFGSIFLSEQNNLKRVYSSSNELENLIPRRRGFTYRSFKKNKVVQIHIDEVKDIHPLFKKLGVLSIVVIPLSYKNTSIGVMTLQFQSKTKFSNEEIHILSLLGSMSSLAIKKSQNLEETRRALETRDMFIALASHEFRTPLTSINGYIQLLYSKLGKQDTSEGKWVRELHDESQRLTSLVKELLEINRIKQGQLQFILTVCDFSKVIEVAIERIRLTNPDRKVIVHNISSSDDTKVVGDFDKLLQMISAILSNSVKFSSSNSEITVELKVLKKLLILKIIDKGEGISEKDLPFIYEEFYQGTNRKENDGFGMGLIMAKHIIKYHKGDINITSAPKKGTTVEIKIPRLL